MATITAEELRSLLSYDAETGTFQWLKTRPGISVGAEQAGWIDRKGYRCIEINGKEHKAHRLAWLFLHGEVPSEQIDHINGDKADNRAVNLRPANTSQNKQNMRKPRADNRSGFLGVHWYAAGRKWRACINSKGKSVHLGNFETPEAAHAKYVEAKRQLHEYGTI